MPSSSPPDSFTLAPEDNTLSTGELADLVARRTGTRPTTQTVRNHAERGTIRGTKDPERGWRFPPAAVDEWVRNAATPRTGGKRRGAGRKPRSGDKPLTRVATDIRAAREAVRERLTADDQGQLPPVDPARMMRTIDVLRCTREELRALVSFGGPDESLLGDAQLRRVSEWLDLQTKQLRLDKEKGTLVPVAEVADAWAEAAAGVAGRLEAIPRQLAPRLAEVCWPGDTTRKTIAQTLKAAGVDGAVISAVLGELARPATLVGRVRKEIEHAVGQAMGGIAEGAMGKRDEPRATSH